MYDIPVDSLKQAPGGFCLNLEQARVANCRNQNVLCAHKVYSDHHSFELFSLKPLEYGGRYI